MKGRLNRFIVMTFVLAVLALVCGWLVMLSMAWLDVHRGYWPCWFLAFVVLFIVDIGARQVDQ